jgi:hypothetical protein
MADYPTFHQMPKGSYPLNCHPIYALVGSLRDIIVGQIIKINKVGVNLIGAMDKVSYSKFNKVNKVNKARN